MLSTQVTRINNIYHARLMSNGKIFDEMTCQKKEHIGWICREMMRWYDKCGGTDLHASRARERHYNDGPLPEGVKYQVQIERK
jgi:hypothetical protein